MNPLVRTLPNRDLTTDAFDSSDVLSNFGRSKRIAGLPSWSLDAPSLHEATYPSCAARRGDLNDVKTVDLLANETEELESEWDATSLTRLLVGHLRAAG